MSVHTLEPGDYYVGDLCYLADSADLKWGLLCEAMGLEECGEFAFMGGRAFWSWTAHGDGGYIGTDGLTYEVDGGHIGAFPLGVLPEAVRARILSDGVPGGHVHSFKHAPRCETVDSYGEIRVGHLTIFTDEGC